MAAKRAAKKQSSLKPVTTIVRKRTVLVPLLVTALLIALAVVIYLTQYATPPADILATVNGEPIYAQDIAREYSRLPPQYQAQLSHETILNQTIDKMLLLQEAAERGITVSDQEIDEYIQSLLTQFGIGEADLKVILGEQNLSLPEYRAFVREELLLSNVVEELVVSRVSVTEREIIEYYESHPDEFQSPPDGAVVSHILVETQEEAASIIAALDTGESFDLLARERSLDTTASDGGYLGIISASLPLPQAFLDAALSIEPNQYTRQPVQTSAGYHVIYRHGNAESLRHVRSRIESQLKVRMQIELFQELLEQLRDEAKITYYTSTGKVTRKPTEASLDDFASCVAGQATLYGTDWSDFLKQQQDLFGDSFEKLLYVDCDEQPDACAAANIQKYPTWIIDGEQHGRLTLAQLSELTGCSLP